ncbi:YrdB family protein [Gryllotalpicola sp.]|uniref:YrdB family protein n=1 Tax=Gryllotalpicola sp. TaxID=1932787 RepID=UPI002613922F|nr:YrdB family protein [Gryllotalpicola sp.]
MAQNPEQYTFAWNDAVRFLLEIFAIVSLAVWGFARFDLPWNWVVGIGASVVALLLWALFRSPRAVIRADAYGKATVEIIVMASAALAWWNLGQPVVAGAFAVVALISGVINGRREFQ